ncbi:MAG TPA: hypothetical protein ENN90_08165 [Mariniphaga anaerophila]|uniref:Uncharacterized protein n=1 Tax=Mariniphaga anaerophila TaxID=1484053 RepID=A0A831LUN4_9BACT|nr:hypothetical protein [Mariniphaga anaerophila]
MTKEQFDDFIAKNDLYGFDGLIKITLENGQAHEAVWITTLPQLEKSTDGKFGGIAEKEVFFLFGKNEYLVCGAEEIIDLDCLQKKYLGGK